MTDVSAPAPATAPARSGPAAPPAAAPHEVSRPEPTAVEKAVDALIGERAIRSVFPGERMTHRMTGLVGAREGYATLGSAIEGARSILGQQPPVFTGNRATGSSLAVVRAGNEGFAVMNLDTPIALRDRRGREAVYGATGYRTFRNDAGEGVAAVLDPWARVLPDLGKTAPWQR